MTIWANWSQIFYWVNFISLANICNLCQMMNVNEVFTNVTIGLLKIKVTN